MQTMKTETREVRVVADVTCNLCGGSCREPLDARGDVCETRGLLGVATDGGYGQRFPEDQEAWRFDLCQWCLGWLVGLFRVRPYGADADADAWAPTPDHGLAAKVHALRAAWLAQERHRG